MLIAFNKPFGVVCQFTKPASELRTLAEFEFPPRVYSLGRLDADSEGLLLLTDEAELNQALLNPQQGHSREYWAQVERVPTATDLARLSRGVVIQGHRTLPCEVKILNPQPDIPPRTPPVRFRKAIPTCWISLVLKEGKNRQVRRMTAAIGFPTLRLIRVRIGQFALGELPPGNWRVLTRPERGLVFA